jgi:TfoX/Sxy family transcriptional regulator of competence genes
MMGGYILYIEDKVAGQINEGELFIKITDFGESFAPELDRKSPYPGAKPAFVIPEENIADQAWLYDFIEDTAKQLLKPKKK